MVPYRSHEATDTTTLSAADGTTLFVRRWAAPEGAGRNGAVLIVHGLGEHSARYGHVASVFNAMGLEAWAHDHRGFGKSEGARARIPERETLIEDAKRVFDFVAERTGSKPMLLGHSMGGAIAARAVTGGWIAPRALVLSSPGLKSFITPFMRSVSSALERLVPNLAVPHGLPLHKITHDLEVLADAAGDKLNHALISPRLTNFILDAGEKAVRNAEKLSVPVLVQAAGEDRLVDVSGAREFAANVPAKLATLKVYQGLFHEIYNEREPDRAAVLADLKEWLSRAALN